MWRRASVLLLLVPAIAHAHPGHGPLTVELIDVDNRFEPSNATVGVGDTVIWRWGGALRNHSVTADDGSFDSDPGKGPGQISHPANDQFTHSYTTKGTFGYHCKVHPQMFGQVSVVPVAGTDVDPPRLSALRVSRAGRRYRVHFVLSEPGDLLARILRGAHTVRSFDLAAHAGRNRGRIPATGLEPGRYGIALTAFDQADNRSATLKRRFRVRR